MRVAVITPDRLGRQMAGPAIRSLEMARVLATAHDVRLVTTAGQEGSAFPVETAGPGRAAVRSAISWADAYVVQGVVTDQFPEVLRSTKPLVVDLFDPMHVELFDQTRGMGPHSRAVVVRDAVRLLRSQIERGDLFLCSSERQWDLWMGHLLALGRVTVAAYDSDPTQREVLVVVPFGLPDSSPPQRGQWSPREQREQIGAMPDGAQVAVWGGGIYDWLDPLTPIRAVEDLRHQGLDVHLVFLGASHPGGVRMQAPDRARRLASELGLNGTAVHFLPWTEYSRRQEVLLGADIGVCAAPAGLESRYAFRTRFLDYLWCGLPIVSTRGDSLAELVERHGAGLLVEAGDSRAYARAMSDLLDPGRRQLGHDSALRLSEQFRWSRVLRPLVEYLADPHASPSRRVRRRPARRAGSARLVAAVRDLAGGHVAPVSEAIRRRVRARLERTR